MKRHICHIITGLFSGGAEMMLYRVLQNGLKGPFVYSVISLTDIGPVGQRIRDIGIPVNALRMPRGFPDPRGILKLFFLLRYKRPHLVQTWMYHADLVGGVTAKIAGKLPVIWNIRHSDLYKEKVKSSTILTAHICAKLSRKLPNRIICCAENAKKAHINMGYDPDKLIVIPNGFDVEKFSPNTNTRSNIRKELGLPPEAKLIGMVARFHRLKDHKNFINAAAFFHVFEPNVHFLLCGRNVEWTNPELTNWIKKRNLDRYFHLLGEREDIPKIMAGLDIATLSSSGEAFPNVVGEAMACGIPCVVTDVGDSAYIVGDTGVVVPPGDPHALAQAWKSILALSFEKRVEIGRKARMRIKDKFDLKSIVQKYQAVWMSVME